VAGSWVGVTLGETASEAVTLAGADGTGSGGVDADSPDEIVAGADPSGVAWQPASTVASSNAASRIGKRTTSLPTEQVRLRDALEDTVGHQPHGAVAWVRRAIDFDS
jgi:hypothetical protein